VVSYFVCGNGIVRFAGKKPAREPLCHMRLNIAGEGAGDPQIDFDF
jgi:hypothetical protein